MSGSLISNGLNKSYSLKTSAETNVMIQNIFLTLVLVFCVVYFFPLIKKKTNSISVSVIYLVKDHLKSVFS